MKNRHLVAVAGIVLALPLAAGCGAAGTTAGEAASSPDEASSSGDSCAVREYQKSVLWQQASAEADAAHRQSFATATDQLDELVAQNPGRTDLALMTDLDETAIDNSELFARDIEQCHDYTSWDDWLQWEKDGTPTAIPGAVDFYQHAQDLGVTVYYVSDRTEQTRPEAITMLQGLGFPEATQDTVRLKGDSKKERREAIQKDHELVMQLGDSLPDFDAKYKDATAEEQKKMVEQDSEHWGTDWIMVSNPTYGSWVEESLKAWDQPVSTDG